VKPIRFIQISDTHLFKNSSSQICGVDTTASLKEVLVEIKRNRPTPDFFLLTGDASQDGTEESYLKLKRILHPLNRPVFCLPGNHDHPARMSRLFKNGRVRFMRDLTWRDWRIILLNSARPPDPGGFLHRRELERLERTSAGEPQKNILISLHHNPVPVKSKWMDRMMVKNNKLFARIIKNRKNLRGVVFGHVHQEYFSKKNGIPYWGVPSTCVQFRPRISKMKVDRRPPGFRWFELYPNGRIRSAVVRLKKFSQKPDYHSKGY
jgi:Icc protein